MAMERSGGGVSDIFRVLERNLGERWRRRFDSGRRNPKWMGVGLGVRSGVRGKHGGGGRGRQRGSGRSAGVLRESNPAAVLALYYFRPRNLRRPRPPLCLREARGLDIPGLRCRCG
jgi:hypothetical protein